jgi:hypothetical protein
VLVAKQLPRHVVLKNLSEIKSTTIGPGVKQSSSGSSSRRQLEAAGGSSRSRSSSKVHSGLYKYTI